MREGRCGPGSQRKRVESLSKRYSWIRLNDRNRLVTGIHNVRIHPLPKAVQFNEWLGFALQLMQSAEFREVS